MLAVHRTLAVAVVLLALAGTLWAVHGWLSRGSIHPRLMTLTVLMSAVIGVQAVLGIVLAIQGYRPADGTTHFVTGPLTLIALPIARRVGAGRSDRAASAVLAVGWLGLLLLTLRAAGSGGTIGG